MERIIQIRSTGNLMSRIEMNLWDAYEVILDSNTVCIDTSGGLRVELTLPKEFILSVTRRTITQRKQEDKIDSTD